MEIDHRVIYEPPLLSGGHLPGLLPGPNLAHGFLVNPSNKVIGRATKQNAPSEPDINVDLIDLEEEEKAKKKKPKSRDRAKSVCFERPKAPAPPPPRDDYPRPPSKMPPKMKSTVHPQDRSQPSDPGAHTRGRSSTERSRPSDGFRPALTRVVKPVRFYRYPVSA